jgi:hypothetical protein
MKVFGLLAVLLISGMAHAQKSDTGYVYLGAGISAAEEEFDLPAGFDADDAFAFDLLGGYRVTPQFAVEAQAQFLGDFDLDGIGGGDIDGIAFLAAAKLYPIPDAAIQPFASAGLGFLDLDGPNRIDANESDWMFALGAGVDFPIADRTILEVKGDYRFPQDDLDDFEYWTLGANLQYRF